MIYEYKVAAIVGAVAFILGVILFKIFIPLLRKVKLGQKILEIGPSWHKAKEGTPNLGGLIFITAMLVAFVVGIILIPKETDVLFQGEVGGLSNVLLLLGYALSQAIIGFIDDYVKLFKKRNKGLSSTQKLVLQFLTTGIYLFVRARYFLADTSFWTPWGSIELGIFYYVIMLLAIVYIVNCANLTDGIDGLAGSIAFIICTMLSIISLEYFKFGLPNPHTALALLSPAILGALLAFLVFNFHPAKIFMGDTGSLFLGAIIVGFVMYYGMEFGLIPISCIWIIEGVSVVLQVLSFKLTGKRIFKMAPIHHHFEKCGWSEVKIVAVFSAITVVFSVISYYIIHTHFWTYTHFWA